MWPFRSALASSDPDEGIVLQGAARILRGQLPYRDFFSFYAPGSYYWNALLMKFFGDSIMAPRTILVLYGAIFSGLTYFLARRVGARKGTAVFAALLLLVICMPVRFLVIHNWDSTMAALLALLCAILLLERASLPLAVLAGLLASLSLLFNQARGAGLAFGLILGFFALGLSGRAPALRARYFIAMAAAFAAPLIAVVAFFAARGALPAFRQDMLWPLQHYSAVNKLPYGYITMPIAKWHEIFQSGPLAQRALNYFVISPIFLLCALPIIVVLASSIALFSRSDSSGDRAVAIAVLTGAVTLGSLASVLATRADFHHITFILPLFFFLLPWLWREGWQRLPSLAALRPLVLVYVVISFVAYGLTLSWAVCNAKVSLNTRRGVLHSQQPNGTVTFIQDHFAPGSELLIHPYLPLYSFLTRTMSPTAYDYLQTGMHTQAQFAEAAAELAQKRPVALLYQPGFIEKIPSAWPRTPLHDLVKDPVADMIVRNYRLCWVLDERSTAPFWFMVRKDLNCGGWR